MTKKDNFALVPRPPGAVAKGEPAAKRILSDMVGDTLALAQAKVVGQSVSALQPGGGDDAERWYQEGQLYFCGRGVPKDYAEALKWYRKAADQGHALAQNSVGACYGRGGYGVPQDCAEAVKWYRKAAEQREAYAQNNLGACYANGEGVIRDHVEALKWYRRAADQGNEVAQANLGFLHARSQSGAMDYPEAVAWCRKAAEQGFAPAQFNLGYCYEHGQGVPQDFGEAAKWYHKAADQGHTSAQENLGGCYANGRAAIDIENAVEVYKWVKLAEEHGYEGASKTAAAIEVLLSPLEFREAERRYDELKRSRQSVNTDE
jgi:TPR repeat protein